MKKQPPQRLVIYPQDVEIITGKSNQAARRLLRKIRLRLGKSEDEFVTITEFCEMTGLLEEQVMALIQQ